MQFVLTGDGSVTQQGGAIEISANPSMTLSNYNGQLSLLGVGTNGYVNITGDCTIKCIHRRSHSRNRRKPRSQSRHQRHCGWDLQLFDT